MTVREYGSGHEVNDAVIGLVRRQALSLLKTSQKW